MAEFFFPALLALALGGLIGLERERSGHPLRVEFEYVDAIEKPKNFKFDIFVSEL